MNFSEDQALLLLMESIYKSLLPATHLSINISTISENTRQIELFAQGEHYEQIKRQLSMNLLLIDTSNNHYQ